jgi:hypothetical protein
MLSNVLCCGVPTFFAPTYPNFFVPLVSCSRCATYMAASTPSSSSFNNTTSPSAAPGYLFVLPVALDSRRFRSFAYLVESRVVIALLNSCNTGGILNNTKAGNLARRNRGTTAPECLRHLLPHRVSPPRLKGGRRLENQTLMINTCTTERFFFCANFWYVPPYAGSRICCSVRTLSEALTCLL